MGRAVQPDDLPFHAQTIAVSHVVVSVRDFGPGVTEEALSHLGSPFYRVDPSRDLATGALGLGLAIARRAIQLHHGLWSVENAGPGLNVTMTVPADVDSSAALT